MESQRTRPRTAADPDQDPAWRIVRRWPGIRGEPKLAWWYLWRMSGQGGQQCVVKAVDLGADQNTSDDAGARYLRTLAREGLIRADDLAAGRKLVTLFDPLDVAKARRACGGDSQLAFGFVDELADHELGEAETDGTEYPPAEVVGPVAAAVPAIQLASEPRRHADDLHRRPTAEPPAEPRSTAVPPAEVRSATADPPAEPRQEVPLHVLLRERIASRARATTTKTDKDKEAQAHQTKTTDSARPANSRDCAHRGSAGGTAPAKVGQTVAAVAGQIGTPQAYHAAVEACQAMIRAAVRDPGADDVIHAAAWANAEGRLPDHELGRLLGIMRSGCAADGTPIDTPGAFFRGMVKRKFRDLGIAPEDYFPKPKPR